MMNGFGLGCTYILCFHRSWNDSAENNTWVKFFKEHQIGDTAPYFGCVVKVTIFFIDCIMIHMLCLSIPIEFSSFRVPYSGKAVLCLPFLV